MNNSIPALNANCWLSGLRHQLRTARTTPFTSASDGAFYMALGMISAARLLDAIDEKEQERLSDLAVNATNYRCREINHRMPLYTYRPTPTTAQEQSA